MGLTPFEFKQMGVTDGPSAPIRAIWLRPSFPHDDTHRSAKFRQLCRENHVTVERYAWRGRCGRTRWQGKLSYWPIRDLC
ncbi:hypothetical protein Y032_0002g831 [Ancylostoma ceylanicum]|uniref:Uncharacterized protein n=1 Tax=Ancylostoma ceylanicum TaxID=53326 RepID=A0A016W1P3_9BILA|nr:hypothetical protein Y032_0002g831 [Ancylostoma ceylanicum]